MDFETQLATRLDDALADLPSLPPDTYLARGRRARRRRRGVVTAAVAAAVAVVAAGATVPTLLPERSVPSTSGAATPGPPVADHTAAGPPAGVTATRDRDDVPPPPTAPGGFAQAVPGLQGVEHFSTERIPEWAQEYGNHGPVGLSPTGRLWVAPDARILQTVVDPVTGVETPDGPITVSYAVEAAFDAADPQLGDVVWVIVHATARTGAAGEMDQPGRWTDDFELWVDDVTAPLQDRPSFEERLVRLDGAERLVAAAPGVQVVRQEPVNDSLLAAEARWDGRTWFVVAHPGGAPWFQAYEPALSAPDLESFLDWAERYYT